QQESVGSNGRAAHRAAVYQTADSRALRKSNLFRHRLLRSGNGLANLLWQKRIKAESLRSRTPCWLDPKPESVFAAKKSGGRSEAARCSLGSDGGVEKDYACRGRTGETGKDRDASEANAADPGELRDGRGAT